MIAGRRALMLVLCAIVAIAIGHVAVATTPGGAPTCRDDADKCLGVEGNTPVRWPRRIRCDNADTARRVQRRQEHAPLRPLVEEVIVAPHELREKCIPATTTTTTIALG